MTVFPSWIDPNSGLIPKEVDYLSAKLDMIVNSLGEKHLSWWEHKGSNQCRICDLIVIGYRLIDLSKSACTLDHMTDTEFEDQCALEQEPMSG